MARQCKVADFDDRESLESYPEIGTRSAGKLAFRTDLAYGLSEPHHVSRIDVSSSRKTLD
jgi:hypothetical protein